MSFKSALMVSAACVASVLSATAQEAADGRERVLDTVVVEGTQLSRRLGIEEKRDALQTIEALGVDELGQLPDKNVGESLNRLAGVSMLVEKGEGRYVQIRGINPSLNNVTINGSDMGSPETEGGGRNAPLDIISIHPKYLLVLSSPCRSRCSRRIIFLCQPAFSGRQLSFLLYRWRCSCSRCASGSGS